MGSHGLVYREQMDLGIGGHLGAPGLGSGGQLGLGMGVHLGLGFEGHVELGTGAHLALVIYLFNNFAYGFGVLGHFGVFGAFVAAGCLENTAIYCTGAT